MCHYCTAGWSCQEKMLLYFTVFVAGQDYWIFLSKIEFIPPELQKLAIHDEDSRLQQDWIIHVSWLKIVVSSEIGYYW